MPVPEALDSTLCFVEDTVIQCGFMNVVVGVTVLREDCRLLSKLHVKCAMCSSSLQMKTEPCALSCSAPWSVMSLSQLFRRLKQYGLMSLSAQAACVA